MKGNREGYSEGAFEMGGSDYDDQKSIIQMEPNDGSASGPREDSLNVLGLGEDGGDVGGENISNVEDAREEKKRRVERIIRSFYSGQRGKTFSLFARDSSLQFEITGDETYSFEPGNMKVNIPFGWFASGMWTDGEIEFANYHELSHFIDMRINPEAFMDRFDHCKKKAEELAREYVRTHQTETDQKKLKIAIYEELGSLYNILDDIYVNDLVAMRAKQYSKGRGRDEVVSAYCKLGYSEPDLTEEIAHRQFANSLIRDAMVSRELGKTIVCDEVAEALSRKCPWLDNRTVPEIVNDKLRPINELIDPGDRYRYIKTAIEPIYIELMMKDIDKMPDERERRGDSQRSGDSSKGGGDGDGGWDDDGDFFGEDRQKPKDFFDGSARNINKEVLDALKEKAEVDKMSPEERRNYQKKKSQEKFDKKYEITPGMREEIGQIEKLTDTARRKMLSFWDNLIGRSVEYVPVTKERQSRGRLNVGSVIKSYANLEAEMRRTGSWGEPKIYDRPGHERRYSENLESIEVSLLVDCSGSMGKRGRVQAAKKATALMLYSLKDFNAKLRNSQSYTRSKLRANSEVLRFGSTLDIPKPFDDRNTRHDDSDAHIIKTITGINDNLGGTNDVLALQEVMKELTGDKIAKMKGEKLRKIVFVITDGRPDDVAKSIQAVRSLAENGVVMVGFKIGDSDADEMKDFQRVWLDGNNKNIKGINVGNDLDDLPDALMTSLKDILKDVRV